MRLSTKIILWSWVLLLITIGSLIYSAYSKLKPDSLVSLINNEIESNYPGSKLSIGHVKYKFSLDFDLTMSQLELKRSDSLMASVGEVQLKVPWWLILLDRGSAQIIINDLIIFVQSPNEESLTQLNFSTIQKEKIKSIKLNLPNYLKDAIYTLRGKNISIKEQNGERRFFTLSKLLIKDFQYGKNSAFEINIPISISHKEKQFSSDLWLFGDLTPGVDIWSFNYRGEFRTKDSNEGPHLDDLVLQGNSRFNPLEVDLESELELKVNQKSVGFGNILARNDKMTFDLSFKNFPISYLNLMGDELHNPHLNIKSGRGDGKLKFVRSLKSDGHSTIYSKIVFPGDFVFTEGDKVRGQWSVSIENDKWETNFISPQGEVSFFRRSVIDFDKGQIRQSTQEIGFTEIDFDQAISQVENFNQFFKSEKNVFTSTLISFKNCKTNNETINGFFKYSISPFENFYQSDILLKDKKFLLNYLSKNGLNHISIQASNFDWRSNYTFLQPFFKMESGTIDGKLTGVWPDNWSEGKWDSSLKFDKIEQLSGNFFDRLKDTFVAVGLEIDKSQQMGLNFKLENKNLQFNSSSLSGINTYIFDGSLSFLNSQKSFIDVRDKKNKIQTKKQMRKEVLNPFLTEG
jgi:hypothetical protein